MSENPIVYSRQGLASQDGARAYDAYMHSDYDTQNAVAKPDVHAESLRAAFLDCLCKYIEQTGRKRTEMSLAVVGIDENVMNREFSLAMVPSVLDRLRRLVLVGVSPEAIDAATKALLRANVNGGPYNQRLRGYVYDISKGLAAAAQQHLKVEAERVRTLDDLVSVADGLAKFRIADLLGSATELAEQGFRNAVREAPASDTYPLYLSPEMNAFRDLRMTVQGQETPLDIIWYSMVLAGTIAPAEECFRGKMYTLLAQHPEETIASRFGDADDFWHRVLRDVHHFVSAYNTEVASMAVRRAIADHPQAWVLVTTDVTTVYRTPDIGSLPRLDMHGLRGQLREHGITDYGSSVGPWHWDDDPHHSHEVEAIIFKRSRTA